MNSHDPVIRTWIDGHLGRIELNRPAALNALTHAMVSAIRRTLDEWEIDPAVRAVAVTGAGDRAFCAGGDIVSIHADAVSDQPAHDSASARFWADEYALNLAIASYPKPFVPIMNGIVLGGGVGISAHGSHRVVTESTSVGMPETGIGFIPDVGGTWLLSHAPGELGTYLALTAGSVQAGDAVHVGLADHFIPRENIDRFLHLLATQKVDAALFECAAEPPFGSMEDDADWIDTCFSHNHPADIVAALRTSTVVRAHAAADKIERNSPTAVTVTLRALREARYLPNLSAALAVEYQVVCNFLDNPDFAEGIRAAVIDKDRTPHWQPPTLADVQADAVEHYFTPTVKRPTYTPTKGATT